MTSRTGRNPNQTRSLRPANTPKGTPTRTLKTRAVKIIARVVMDWAHRPIRPMKNMAKTLNSPTRQPAARQASRKRTIRKTENGTSRRKASIVSRM